MRPLILRLDISGQPLGWVQWQDAAVLYTIGKVVWTAGEKVLCIRGGRNRFTNQQTVMNIHSIVACRGMTAVNKFSLVPPLNNRELFRRDRHMCLYCLDLLSDDKLTRDHVHPISRGGSNNWTNVVTACRPCNEKKGARTPDEANMKLHAVPYPPNFAEWLTLRNRRILADQMAFLKTRFVARHERHLFRGLK